MNCKNCDIPLSKSQRYCFECGARVIKNRLTIKTLFHQINAEFLSVDNKLLKTFMHLFSKPEVVINGFIDGTRKKYMGVIQYLAIALTLLGLQVFLMENVFNDPDMYTSTFLEEMAKKPGQENNPFLNPNSKFSDFNSFQSLYFTISLPFSALATWVAFWVVGFRQFNFTEHIVLNIYYGAQVTIFSTIIYIATLAFGINYFATSLFITILFLIYFFHVLKRVFKMSFLMTFGMFILTGATLGIAVGITLIIIVIVGFIFVLMNKEKFITSI